MAIKHGSLYVKTSQEWVQISLPVNVTDIIDLSDNLNNKIKINTLLTTSDPTTGKIQKQFIPNEILAGLTYGGTCVVNINNTATASISTEGLYFLDNKATSQTLQAGTNSNHADYNGLFFIVEQTQSQVFAEETFETGDWLVATADGWHKIDNTDLVTSVNNRKGAVSIYQNSHDSNVIYEVGDVVSDNGGLYICIKRTGVGIALANTTYWASFGKNWTSQITELQSKINELKTTAEKLPSYNVGSSAPTGDAVVGSIWIQV